jgi:DeoR family transcriptional regulator, L-fucose operon activator
MSPDENYSCERKIKSMLASERHLKILNLVNERGTIEVNELSKLCQVTRETIRRDLEKLGQDGKINRIHGGALKATENHPEIPYFEREITNTNEKMEIAVKALEYISSNDQIILDASSTAWFVAKVLPNIPITVLTNSTRVVAELEKKDKIQVISTGGLLLQSSMCFVGLLAQMSLNMYHVNKAFISSKGIHYQWGVSEANELAISVKRKMIEISDEIILLMDYSKFGVQDFLQVSPLDQINLIITDSKTSLEQISDLKEFSSKVVQARPIGN